MTAPATRKRLAITPPPASATVTLEDHRDGQKRKQRLAARAYLECQVMLWTARHQLDGLARHLAEPWDTSKPKRGKYADAVRAAAVILRHPGPQAIPPAGDATILPEERKWREHDHALPPVAEVVPTVAIIGSQAIALPPMDDPVTGDMPADVDERAERWAAGGDETADSPDESTDGSQPVQDPPHEPALDERTEGETP